MKVNFVDLRSQYERIDSNVKNAMHKVLDDGRYLMGPEVFELEEKLSQFCGAKHTVTCSSGTDALTMSLSALNIGPDDAVITTPFTFFATVESICHVGATPVFVDIEPGTFNLDPAKLDAAIEKIKQEGKLTLKAIIPVDIFGEPADYKEISDIAKKHNAYVIADAAQSFGSQYKDHRTGGYADVTTTSFYPTKPLSCYGDGGAVFTNDDDIAFELRSVRIHGQSDNKYISRRLGFTARMDTIQAAVVLQKLPLFEEELSNRLHVANKYHELFAQAGLDEHITPPTTKTDRVSAWAHYSILVDNPEELTEKLREVGIPSMRYYPVPMHLQDPLEYLGYSKGDFPVCEDVSNRVISLPLHPYMKDSEIEYVVEQLVKIYK